MRPLIARCLTRGERELPGKAPRASESLLHSSGALTFPLPAGRAINGHTLASRRLGKRAYWAIFRN